MNIKSSFEYQGYKFNILKNNEVNVKNPSGKVLHYKNLILALIQCGLSLRTIISKGIDPWKNKS